MPLLDPAVTAPGPPSEPVGLRRPTAGVLLYATGPVLIGYSSLPGPTFVFWRLLAGVPALVAAAMVLEPQQLMRAWSDHRRTILIGGVLFGANQVFVVQALRLTNVADVTLVTAALPIVTGLGAAALFRERQRPVFWWGTFVAVAGTVVIGAGAEGSSLQAPLGIMFAGLSIFAFSGFLLVMKRAAEAPPLSYLAGVNGASWVLVAMLSGIAGSSLEVSRTSDVMCILAVAIFSGSIGHALFVGGMSQHSPVVLASLKLLHPVLASGIAWLVLGQSLTGAHYLGGALVLAGVGLVARDRRRISAISPLDRGVTEQ